MTRMDKMTESILNLTLEIVYLLNGEDYSVVKKTSEDYASSSYPCVSGRWIETQSPITTHPLHSLMHEKSYEHEILELTNKIIVLLTGEVPIRCQDVSVYFSMEEWEYLEGYKDLYKDVMMEDRQPFTSPGSSHMKSPHNFLYKTVILSLNDPLRIHRYMNKMTERLLNLTLEIIYLQTGEVYTIVKKTSGECEMQSSRNCGSGGWSQPKSPITVTPFHSLKQEKNNDKKILELTNKIIELVTGEIPIRIYDVSVYFSMAEWEYIEGHKDLYKDIMIEKCQPHKILDGPSERNPPERCTLYSEDCSGKNHNVPQNFQIDDLFIVKVEDIDDDKEYVRSGQWCKEQAIPASIIPVQKNLYGRFIFSAQDLILFINAPVRMDIGQIRIFYNIFNLTQEIIYLLTGEEYTLGKKTSSKCVTPISHPRGSEAWSRTHSLITMPQSYILIYDKSNAQKILKLANKMVELLTREVPLRCQDLSVYFNMEEWEYIEGHRDLYKDMMEDSRPFMSPDGTSERNPSKNRPSFLYSPDYNEENRSVSSHQGENFMSVKVDQQCKEMETSIGGSPGSFSSQSSQFHFPLGALHKTMVIFQNDPLRMEKYKKLMTERVLNISLEIIYLLTRENFAVVKKISSECVISGSCSNVSGGRRRTQNPMKLSQTQSLISERRNEQKILELTNKIIELLTGEVFIRRQDVAVYFSMEEWEYLEEHKEMYEEVMMESQQPLTLLADESSQSNPPEKYPQSCAEENPGVPHDYQGEDIIDLKVEIIESEEETCDQQPTKEEFPTDTSTDSLKKKTLNMDGEDLPVSRPKRICTKQPIIEENSDPENIELTDEEQEYLPPTPQPSHRPNLLVPEEAPTGAAGVIPSDPVVPAPPRGRGGGKSMSHGKGCGTGRGRGMVLKQHDADRQVIEEIRIGLNKDLLIDLVQERPAIWDSATPLHFNHHHCVDLWTDISRILVSEYDDWDAEKQELCRKGVQNSWRSMRDRFIKDLKAEQERQRSGAGASTATPYCYGERLQFLRRSAQSRRTSSNTREPRVLHEAVQEVRQSSVPESGDGSPQDTEGPRAEPLTPLAPRQMLGQQTADVLRGPRSARSHQSRFEILCEATKRCFQSSERTVASRFEAVEARLREVAEQRAPQTANYHVSQAVLCWLDRLEPEEAQRAHAGLFDFMQGFQCRHQTHPPPHSNPPQQPFQQQYHSYPPSHSLFPIPRPISSTFAPSHTLSSTPSLVPPSFSPAPPSFSPAPQSFFSAPQSFSPAPPSFSSAPQSFLPETQSPAPQSFSHSTFHTQSSAPSHSLSSAPHSSSSDLFDIHSLSTLPAPSAPL